MTFYEYYGPRNFAPVPRVPAERLSKDEYERGVSMHGEEAMEAWYRPEDSDFHSLFMAWVANASVVDVKVALARARRAGGFDFDMIEKLARPDETKTAKKKTSTRKKTTTKKDND